MPWVPGHFGDHAVEQTLVIFNVQLPGQPPRSRELLVTHDEDRAETGKSTPNTWIHWDDATRDELRANNYAGRRIVLGRSNSGALSLVIA